MRVIQEGDIVVISKTVDLSKYSHDNGWYTALRIPHLGELGRAVKVSRTSSGKDICYVDILETSPTIKAKRFYWYTDDISLSSLFKWRRQSIKRGG